MPGARAFGGLAFWVLLPLAGLQGLAVRRRALRLPPPPGAGRGRVGEGTSGEPLRLFALGDSIVAGIGAEHWEASLAAQVAAGLAERTGRPVDWRADGESGHAIADLLERVAAIAPDTPADVVLVSIGVNDVTGLTALRHWRRQVAELADRLRERWPDALVVFAGLPPMERFPLPPQPLRRLLGARAHRLDRLLAGELVNRSGMLHVETRIDPAVHAFCPDGFHPSAETYAIWGRELAAILLPSAGTGNRPEAPSQPPASPSPASQSRGAR